MVLWCGSLTAFSAGWTCGPTGYDNVSRFMQSERKNMRTRSLATAVLVMAFFGVSVVAQQPQDKSKRPSPPATAETTLKGQKITIDYSRPSMKGRKIVGGLVPYGRSEEHTSELQSHVNL